VAVLGARSLVRSAELRRYIADATPSAAERVHPVNASELIELVESGRFLTQPAHTRDSVARFAQQLRGQIQSLAVITLSSTHLPWLRNVLAMALPGVILLDPLEHVVPLVAQHGSAGSGITVCIATSGPGYSLVAFRETLDRVGVDLPVTEARWYPRPPFEQPGAALELEVGSPADRSR
jgi:glutamate racemase